MASLFKNNTKKITGSAELVTAMLATKSKNITSYQPITTANHQVSQERELISKNIDKVKVKLDSWDVVVSGVNNPNKASHGIYRVYDNKGNAVGQLYIGPNQVAITHESHNARQLLTNPHYFTLNYQLINVLYGLQANDLQVTGANSKKVNIISSMLSARGAKARISLDNIEHNQPAPQAKPDLVMPFGPGNSKTKRLTHA